MSREGYDRYRLNCERPHLVLLGAGASRAAFPKGEVNEKRLPLMSDFVETVYGLKRVFDSCGIDYKGKNFEDIYCSFLDDAKYDRVREETERLVYDYFVDMELPDEPTLYDHLVLSLTGRDAIATFNWDPFLWQAICRNYERVGEANIPRPLYLHGNTAIGVCTNHDKIQISHCWSICSKCGKPVDSSKLLFPTNRKDYSSDKFIINSWDSVKRYLQHAYMFTVFGYSAPLSDIEAVTLLTQTDRLQEF